MLIHLVTCARRRGPGCIEPLFFQPQSYDPEFVQEMYSQYANNAGLHLSGGEPLIARNLKTVIELAHRYFGGKVALSTTNIDILSDRQKARHFMHIYYVAAGKVIPFVNIDVSVTLVCPLEKVKSQPGLLHFAETAGYSGIVIRNPHKRRVTIRHSPSIPVTVEEPRSHQCLFPNLRLNTYIGFV